MTFKFESNLDFQHTAIESVCDLFRGQEICRSEFTVTHVKEHGIHQSQQHFTAGALGVGNKLSLLDEEIHSNLKEIQLRNLILPSEALSSGDFTVEMETGTGKTYVYLRTIFELNKRYGFTKFVIVVPSVAIKEGVYKTLQMTKEHIKDLYAGVPYDYFLYDSKKLGEVRNFATSSQIQIMVVTVGAINKGDVNNLYKDSEKTGGERPIDLIRATQPVLIVDEPQSVDGGITGRGKEALSKMNPLCTLRYSATHTDKHHMVYRLDAVDAYERKLVKQIEVASATVENAFNQPYVRLLKVKSTRGTVAAKVEIDLQGTNGAQRKEITVQDGDDLEQTTGRAIYANHRIGEISAGKNKRMELRIPGDEKWLEIGEAYGDIDSSALHREMIRRTIREHLDKELRLRPQGIKVLSLFFIDKVANYRQYDESGNSSKGMLATIFEEEYKRAANNPNYQSLFEGVDLETATADVHDGYFSMDKKGTSVDTKENNQAGRDNAGRAYSLIMKKKEELLDLKEPLKFIFSHSALKEGWDNPNVFQICTLRDIQTERERRQTIGRGLRLCVKNINGKYERVQGFDVNTLTVIALEDYESFAENLQKEIEAETGITFGIVEPHQFALIPTTLEDGSTGSLGAEDSKVIYDFLKKEGYLGGAGKVEEDLKVALKENSLNLPPEFEEHRPAITAILRKHAGKINIKNADERRTVRTREAVLQSAEFKELWDRIKHKSTYRVNFDNDELLAKCTESVSSAPVIPKSKLYWRKADLQIGQAGVEAQETEGASQVTLDEVAPVLPDLITELQDRTQLTRRSIVKILQDSERLNDFKHNPQKFIDLVGDAINKCKKSAVVDGIKYQRLGEEHYFAQELFHQEELTGYLKNLINAEKSVYEKVVYDLGVEKSFASDLESNTAVKVYAKLPGWFKIPTPLGSYNPDWAVLIEQNNEDRLYFVVETKSSLFESDLRTTESAKIECGKEHFKAISVNEDSAAYCVATSVGDLMDIVDSE